MGASRWGGCWSLREGEAPEQIHHKEQSDLEQIYHIGLEGSEQIHHKEQSDPRKLHYIGIGPVDK